jgi:hypothetical protein
LNFHGYYYSLFTYWWILNFHGSLTSILTRLGIW